MFGGNSLGADATLKEVRIPHAERSAAAEATTGDRRPGVRFRSIAAEMEAKRHRADRALPEQQKGEEIRRWSEAATLQTALNYRTQECLAGTVPTIARPS